MHHVAPFQARLEFPQTRAGQQNSAAHDLEAVDGGVFRVGGHQHAPVRIQTADREIEHRCRHHTQVKDLATGSNEALGQGRGQFGPRGPAIPSQDQGALALRPGLTTQGTAEFPGQSLGQGFTGHPLDATGAENFFRKFEHETGA